MRILDRYVLRRFALWLGLCTVALWMIAVIIDLVETIDLFIDHRATAGQIANYYLYRSPYWIVLTVPIACLLATMFSITGLTQFGEITAMRVAGVSTTRLLRPLYLFTLLFCGGVFLFTNTIVPVATFRFNSTKDEIRRYSRGDGSRRQVLLQDVDGQLLFARSYDHTRQRAHQVQWERRRDHRIIARAAARLLDWDGMGWTMRDGTYYSFPQEAPHNSALAWASFDSLALDGLTLRPEAFAQQQKKPEEMSYGELRRSTDRALSAGEDATRHLVDLHLKISFPLTCLVMVLLAAPVAANMRAGRTNSFGVGILVCFVFYSCVKAGQALG